MGINVKWVPLIGVRNIMLTPAFIGGRILEQNPRTGLRAPYGTRVMRWRPAIGMRSLELP